MNYKREIWARIRGELQMRYRFLPFVLIATVVALGVTYLVETHYFGPSVAKGNIVDYLLFSIVAEGLAGILWLLNLRYYAVPANIFFEQANQIQRILPETLNVGTERFRYTAYPGKGENEFIPMLAYEIENIGNRKITGLYAHPQKLVFKREGGDADLTNPNTRLAWDNGLPEKELSPGEKGYVVLATIEGKGMRLGAENNRYIKAAAPGIWFLQAVVWGKYEGDARYQRLEIQELIYFDGSRNLLSFADVARKEDQIVDERHKAVLDALKSQ